MSDVPSMSLRFVRRKAQRPVSGLYGPFMEDYTINVLQQGFYPGGGSRIEWRDIPCIDEPVESNAEQSNG